MNRLSCLCGAAAAILMLAGCEKPDNGYEGINYIYLSTEGNTTVFEADPTPIVVDVTLTTSLDKDLVLTFTTSDKDGVVRLEDNPVTIKAGTNSGQFKIVSNTAGKLDAAKAYKASLSADCALPEKVQMKGDFDFTVTPVVDGNLTEEQQAIIDAYKASTGIDISKYLGFVNVSTVYIGSDLDSGEPLDPETITGKSIITLSDKSEIGKPVLKMTANPMGIQDKMYRNLRTATIENENWYYTEEEGGIADYATLMNAINWSRTSDETFVMSLDGITLASDKSVTFLGTGLSQYDDEISIVPFEYVFSAYEREKAAIADGTLAQGDEWYSDATARPSYHINCDDISEDWYEAGNWTEASASISADKLEFVFCVYPNSVSSDYVRVTATYTPNK